MIEIITQRDEACWIDLCPACVAVAAVKAMEIKAENMR